MTQPSFDRHRLVDFEVIQQILNDEDDLEHSVIQEREENMNVKDEMINTANFAKQAAREDQEGTAPTLSRVASTAEFKTLDGSRLAD